MKRLVHFALAAALVLSLALLAAVPASAQYLVMYVIPMFECSPEWSADGVCSGTLTVSWDIPPGYTIYEGCATTVIDDDTTYILTCWIEDADGNLFGGTITVIRSAITLPQLIAYGHYIVDERQESGMYNEGEAHALDTMLSNTLWHFGEQRYQTAANNYQAFVNAFTHLPIPIP